jgi:hypothetical protein
VDFAEVNQFIDMPIKYYSSGMYVRLGFSIAAHLNPDVLLLDEVLAVGDLAFQQKCLRRIGELRDHGKTIIFVSHDLGAVERLCDRALLMRRGELVADASPREVIAAYQQTAASGVDIVVSQENSIASVSRFEFCDVDGMERSVFHTGGPFSARIHYVAREAHSDVCFYVVIYDMENKVVTHLTNEHPGEQIVLEPGVGFVEFTCPELGLIPGIYQVDLGIKARGTTWGDDLHWLSRCAILRVENGTKTAGGKFHMPHTWRCVQTTLATTIANDNENVVAQTSNATVAG